MKRVLSLLLITALFLTGPASCGNRESGREEPRVVRTSREETEPEDTESMSEGSETSEEPSWTPPSDENYTRALAKKNQDFDPEDAEISEILIEPQEEKPWTVMIYMIGSNLESALGAGSADMAEMENAGLDFSRVNLVLYTGGSTRWTTNIPCDRNCVIDMSRDPDSRVVASTKKNADMGAKETLSRFVNLCTDYYPAEHFALILWDHGAGPLWGYGSDELFGSDGLLLTEMDLAMGETLFSGARNLDFVGFDACLMACLENMSIWEKYADYYVGSEETEPGDGWDYSWLSVLNQTDDPVEITGAVTEACRAYYEAKKSDYYDPDVTISAADLSRIGLMQRALGNTAAALADYVKTGGFADLAARRSSAKSFGLTGKAEEGTLYAYDLADLGNLAEKIGDISRENADMLKQRISELVIHNYSNVENACGVTLYYPSGNRGQFHEMRESYRALGLNAQYEELLNLIGRQWENAERKDWTIPALEHTDTGEYILQLTEKQRERLVRTTVTILLKAADGEYIPVLSDCRADPDRDGVIRLPEDPELLALSAGENTVLWPMSEAENTKRRVIYQTRNTRLLSGGISTLTRLVSEFADISIVLQKDVKNGKLSIRTINSVSGDADSSGKETVNVSHYDSIYYFFTRKVPAYRADGSLLPLSEWKDGTLTGSRLENLEDSFGFTAVKASGLSEDLYYLVTIEDESGERYVAEPSAIEPADKCRKASVRTEKGELHFVLYDDHAELESYSGADETLEIPERVEGLSVTKIGNEAFGKSQTVVTDEVETLYYPLKSLVLPDSVESIGSAAFFSCRDLSEIRLPESLREIGARAFGSCSALKTIALPESLQRIGAYAFSECGLLRCDLPAGILYIGRGAFACSGELRKITLSEENEAYTVKDGILYRKDLREAAACPAAMTGTAELPKECERILSDCFSMTRLSEVILPEGLREIGNYAFYDAKGLRFPALPDSLETVGKYAFSAAWHSLRLSGAPAEKQVIAVGKNLRYIGTEAFSGLMNREFSADPGNPRYSAREGALLSKAGDSIIEFAANPLKSYVIPEGVKDFDIRIMEQIAQHDWMDNSDPCDIYIPDSVIRVSGVSRYTDSMVFHCSEGSPAESYASREGIAVSYDTEPVTGELDVETEQGRMHFMLTGSHAVLYSYRGEDAKITVPREVEGLPVTVIGSGLSAICDIRSGAKPPEMVLPDTVEVLSAHAFESFGDFSVNIPDSVRIIGERAFYLCTTEITALPEKLEELGSFSLGSGCSFGEGCMIPASIRWISPGAFAGVSVPEFRLENSGTGDYQIIDGNLCSNDGEVGTILLAAKMPDADGRFTVPEGTVYIGNAAFMGLPLTEITIPGSVQLIAQYAFAGCGSLRKLTMEEGVREIGSYSFMYTGLTELSVPESVRRIGIQAFEYCESLESVETGAAQIESLAFGYCPKLTKLTLREGVREIGTAAFFETGIAEAKLPESLYILGMLAFSDEDAHVREGAPFNLEIGRNLSAIGANAFGGLPIENFRVSPENASYAEISGLLTDKAGKTLAACPPGREGTVEVPEGILEIGEGAFCSCEAITDAVIPESVRIIRAEAFNSYEGDEPGSGRERIVIHCRKGSAAERFALENNWPCVIDE